MGAEAAAFSAHEQLDNLIIMYDSNDVTLDKMAEYTMSEDTAARYVAYGWDVVTIDGHDLSAVSAVSQPARNSFPSVLASLVPSHHVTLWFDSSVCLLCLRCGGWPFLVCRRNRLLAIGHLIDTFAFFALLVGVFRRVLMLFMAFCVALRCSWLLERWAERRLKIATLQPYSNENPGSKAACRMRFEQWLSSRPPPSTA